MRGANSTGSGSSVLQLTLYLGKRDYVDHVSDVDRVGTFLLVNVCEKPRGEDDKYNNDCTVVITDGLVKLDTKDFGNRKGKIPKS